MEKEMKEADKLLDACESALKNLKDHPNPLELLTEEDLQFQIDMGIWNDVP